MAVPGFVSQGAKVLSQWANDVVSQLVPSVWTAPVFQNGWIDYGAGYQTARYRKLGDIVYIEGLIKSGTIGLVAFTLPAGLRPVLAQQFGGISNGAFGYIHVANAGTVTPVAGNAGSVWINCNFSTL